MGSKLYVSTNYRQKDVKSLYFDQMVGYWPRPGFLSKNWKFGQIIMISLNKWEKDIKNQDLGQELGFWPKIGILAEDWDFGRKFEFWSKIGI
mgnify:CR=1 FL=1